MLNEKAGGEHGEKESWEDIEKNETMIYQLLKWGHFLALISIFTTFVLKKQGWHNTSQILQCVVTPSGYMLLMPIVIYYTKKHGEKWEE